MAQQAFDRKFGTDRVQQLPTGPGVYLFRDADAKVIYVGKAKNVRRRLQSYRNASRRRAHRKMRTLVREASSLEVRPQATEQQALLTENALIQQLRPAYNVDGAYAFLYPALGLTGDSRRALLAFTTEPQTWAPLSLRWYGVFRSRPRAKEAFEALCDLLCLLGHRDSRPQLPARQPVRGARLVGVRQLPRPVLEALHSFWAGEDRRLLGLLATELLAKPRARREAGEVQARLRILAAFYEADCQRLHAALRTLGKAGTFVAQAERDALFIQAGS